MHEGCHDRVNRARRRWRQPATISVMLTSLLAAVPPATPNWTDKWQAVGSIGGLVAGSFAAAFTGWLVWHEIRQARKAIDRAEATEAQAAVDREEARRDREMARLDRKLIEDERRDAEANEARTVVTSAVQVRSLSDDSLRAGWSILNYGPKPILFIESYLIVPADGPDNQLDLTHRVDVIGPHDPAEVGKYVSGAVVTRSGEELPSSDLVPVIVFTDANGRRWRRVNNGQPQRIAGESRQG